MGNPTGPSGAVSNACENQLLRELQAVKESPLAFDANFDAKAAGKVLRTPEAHLPVSWVDYCNKYGIRYALMRVSECISTIVPVWL